MMEQVSTKSDDMKRVVVIITDGKASATDMQYRAMAEARILEAKKDGWSFIYANGDPNEDAIQQGQLIGLDANSCINVNMINPVAMAAAGIATARAISCPEPVAFTVNERGCSAAAVYTFQTNNGRGSAAPNIPIAMIARS